MSKQFSNLESGKYFRSLLCVSFGCHAATTCPFFLASTCSVYITVSPLSASLQTMAEYSSLLSDLSENITNEDLEQLKSACKEDIPEDQSNNITSSKEWFSYLEKNDKLAQGELPHGRSP